MTTPDQAPQLPPHLEELLPAFARLALTYGVGDENVCSGFGANLLKDEYEQRAETLWGDHPYAQTEGADFESDFNLVESTLASRGGALAILQSMPSAE